MPFDEIAATLNINPAAARHSRSRARKAVADGDVRRNPDLGEQRRVLDAFPRRRRKGEPRRLLAVLAPEVTVTGDGRRRRPATRPRSPA
jgi:RNA polymerase sigma-70 factor (ECF subfamily)